MKQAVGGKNLGYTILETMIFLAVSAAMFVSAMAFISGRQNRTEFTSAVRDFESSMNDLANDVSNGYYSNSANGNSINCTASGTSLTINTQPTDSQGSHIGCLFLGKAIQFMPSSANGSSKYVQITLVGLQYKNGSVSQGDIETYNDAKLAAVAPGTTAQSSGRPDGTVVSRIGGGVTVECAFYSTSTITPAQPKPCTTAATKIDTVAFMTKLHATDFQGNKQSGSASINLVVPTALNAPASIPRSTASVVDSLNAYTDGSPTQQKNVEINPASGVYICLQSNGTDQYALVKLGGNDSQYTTKVDINTGNCK